MNNLEENRRFGQPQQPTSTDVWRLMEGDRTSFVGLVVAGVRTIINLAQGRWFQQPLPPKGHIYPKKQV